MADWHLLVLAFAGVYDTCPIIALHFTCCHRSHRQRGEHEREHRDEREPLDLA
ncbi:hypothetical protein SDC9_128688 [bioreactor metagenome]|uniref:Uncharacterized protein n=1 Tax=bioreactor metagenome TaxID=1076179 RepID=A0A645CYG7_9ZZZZ